LQGINRDKTEQIEEEQGNGVTRPAHLILVADAGQTVEAALDRPQPDHKQRNLSLINADHIDTQWPGEQQQGAEIERQLPIAVTGHEKSSGKKSTASR